MELQVPTSNCQSVDLEEFLNSLTECLGMTVIEGPHIAYGKTISGRSACVLFEESGAMVHTFDESGLVTIFVDSCAKFRIRDLKQVIRRYFHAHHIRHLSIKPLR